MSMEQPSSVPVKSSYADFLVSKRILTPDYGITAHPSTINPQLFDFQRHIVRWALKKGRAAIWSDCGCVAGETMMQGPDGSERIDILAARGEPIRVWSLNSEGSVVPAWASAPFLKGQAAIYEFRLESGRSIRVTEDHRFLTSRGWTLAANVAVGSLLAVGHSSAYANTLQDSISERDRSMFASSDPRCAETPLGCSGCYSACRHRDDERSLQAQGDARADPPLRGGAHAHSQPLLHADDVADESGHSHPDLLSARHSTMGYLALGQSDCADVVRCRSAASLSRWNPSVFRESGQSLLEVPLPQLDDELQQHRFWEGAQCAASAILLDTVIAVNYIRTDDYYDLQVPIYENYLANGVWNHNTGKTPMQLEWARHVAEHTKRPVLILAPLAVSQQTKREGEKFGIPVAVCRHQEDVRTGVNVTNYEMLQHFDPAAFGGIVLDESSILKSYDGVYRRQITEFAASIGFRLACTATPAPNDLVELVNHSEFLGVMRGKEMIALFFIQDGNTTHAWRLKNHARVAFWRWLSTWAVALRKPSDMGYDDGRFILPELHIHQQMVEAKATEGRLFAVEAQTLSERRDARRDSIDERVARCVQVVKEQDKLYDFGYERRKESSSQGIHETISAGTPGEVATDTGEAGEGQCPPQAALRGGPGVPRRVEAQDPGMVDSTPREEESQSSEGARNRPDGLERSASAADGAVRDLRVFGSLEQELLSGGGSRSQDWGGSGAPLHELQPGSRQVQRRSESDLSGLQLPRLSKWLVWCNLNAEQDALLAAFRKAGISVVSIDGRTPGDQRIELEREWREGDTRVLISKPLVFGFGMNWQHCAQMIFVGLSDSFEQLYQAIRRCWRFGQVHEVHAHVIVAESEGAVVANIQRKEKQASDLMDNLVQHMSELHFETSGRHEMEYHENERHGQDWTMYLGDCVEMMDRIETESVGLTVTSPPFPGMYAYSNSIRDLGNTKNVEEMIDHFQFVVARDKLLRITMPGRMACIHLTQAPIFKSRDGYTGMADFRGRVIQSMIDAGWIYYGEVTIDKNPQVKAQRTKERGLLFKTLQNDSSHMRMAMADYLLYFRKPGDNPKPIKAGMTNEHGWITNDEWIEWAHPVWYAAHREQGGIRETDVLPVAGAREADDEKHICALQLGVVERAVKLWSAPGDLVFDPFTGIGSTGFRALQLGRRFVGTELKEGYFEASCRNLAHAAQRRDQPDLFSTAGVDLEEAAV